MDIQKLKQIETLLKNGYTEVKADRNTIEGIPIVYETDRHCLSQHLKFTVTYPASTCKPKKA
jgi:hypothetical protein